MYKGFWGQAYLFFTTKWLLSWVIIFSTSLWVIIYRFFGSDLGLVDSEGPTNIAKAVTVGVIAVSGIYSFLKSAADNYHSQRMVKTNKLYAILHESMNHITKRKSDRFCGFAQNPKRKGQCAFHSITQPVNQIERILEMIQETFQLIYKVPKDRIGLSLAVMRRSGDWEWVKLINEGDDISPGDIISRENSTFAHLLSSDKKIVFFPKKAEAIKQQHYWPSSKDEPHNNVGSILCLDLSKGSSCNFTKSIVTVSTYGFELCKKKSGHDIEIIKNIILESFAFRLRLEVGLLYLKNEIFTKCEDCDACPVAKELRETPS